MPDKKDYSKVKITHVMADGTVRDSVKGYITDVAQLPYAVRNILEDFAVEAMRKRNEHIG